MKIPDIDMLDIFGTVGRLTGCVWCLGEVRRAYIYEGYISPMCVEHDGCPKCDAAQSDLDEALSYLAAHFHEHHRMETE